MKPYDWNKQKSILLRAIRGVGFEEIVNATNEGYALAVIKHPNQHKYPTQRILIVNFNSYVYCVPFIESEEVYFLKTIYPSRKYTKMFLKGKG
jgi:hypothetical protein